MLICPIAGTCANFKHYFVFKDFHEPLVVSYKDNCQWWSAVELGRRFLFILFIVALPQNDVS